MPAVAEVPEPETNQTPSVHEPDTSGPKVPLWKAALKQKKEAQEKKETEEQKRMVSIYSCIPNYILYCIDYQETVGDICNHTGSLSVYQMVIQT